MAYHGTETVGYNAHLPTAGGGSHASARMTGGNAGKATETKINFVLEFLFFFFGIFRNFLKIIYDLQRAMWESPGR